MITSITAFDLNVLRFINEKLHFPVLNEIMWFITHLAEPFIAPIYPLIFVIIGAVVYYKRKKANALDESWRDKFDFAKLGWMMGVALLLGLIVCNLTLKPLIARPRPYTVEGYEFLRMVELQSEKSFPSGHSVAVFEMAFAVAYYCKKKGRGVWGVVAYIMACLIAYSRLYVGVHYPTDVIAGAIIGTICGIFGVIIVSAVYKKFVEPRIYKAK